MNLALWVSCGTAALVGLLLGAGVAWQMAGRRAEARERRLIVAAKEQYATGTQGLRATNTRLQATLDQEKESVQARLSAAAADHRAALARVEGQLRFAYAEIDRLQASNAVHAGEDPADASGFALTRPYSR